VFLSVLSAMLPLDLFTKHAVSVAVSEFERELVSFMALPVIPGRGKLLILLVSH